MAYKSVYDNDKEKFRSTKFLEMYSCLFLIPFQGLMIIKTVMWYNY